MSINVLSPIAQFYDTDGLPLNNGYVYIGVANANPETSPITVYSDEAMTQPVAQPIRTVYGYASGNGSPLQLFAAASFSITVKNRWGMLVYYNKVSSDAVNFNTLAASTGSSLVGTIATGTGAVAETQQTVNRKTVYASGFGALGNGIADDTAAILNACNSLGVGGGTVVINKGMRCLINTNFSVPANVAIVGPYDFAASPGRNVTVPYASFAGLLINSAVTVTLLAGASISGLFVFRAGMTFPAADATAYAGTAITAGGDDIAVSKCLIIGFNQAISVNGFQGPRIEYVWHDNINGILINNCFDVPYVFQCHAWPFGTIGAGAVAAKDRRSGIAYNFTNVNDDDKISNCFAYNYFSGFVVNGAGSMTLLNCTADANTALPWAGQIGFTITGASNDTRLIACQASAQDTGYQISTTAGSNYHTRLIGSDAWACTSRGVLINSGDTSILGGVQRNTVNGIAINSLTATIVIDDVRFAGNTNSEIAFLVANSTTYIGKNNDFQSFAAGVVPISGAANLTMPTIASIDPLPLPNNGDVFNVSGVTNIGTISSGWAGRQITLVFSGILTVFTSVGAINTVRLSGGANFTTAANSTLTIKHNGVRWNEVGRST